MEVVLAPVLLDLIIFDHPKLVIANLFSRASIKSSMAWLDLAPSFARLQCAATASLRLLSRPSPSPTTNSLALWWLASSYS